MRSQSSLFLIHKVCFMFLSFLSDHSLRFFLFAKPVYCFSVFYVTAIFAFPYSQSSFSLFLCFFPHHCLLFFLSSKVCFLFLSFLRDHRLHFCLSYCYSDLT